MKKIIVIAACLFSLTSVVNAQEAAAPATRAHSQKEAGTAEQRAQKQVDRLSAEVSLTEAQKPKVYELTLTRVKKVDEIKAKYKDPNDKERTAALATVKKEYREALKALMTPEQIEKAKSKAKEMRAAKKSSAGAED